MWVPMLLSPLPSPFPVSPPGPAPGSRLEADVDLLRDLHRLALDPGHDLLPPPLAPDLSAGGPPQPARRVPIPVPPTSLLIAASSRSVSGRLTPPCRSTSTSRAAAKRKRWKSRSRRGS